MKYIKNFSDISIDDIDEVGGKNASLGEMISQLSQYNISVPGGFAVTADAYWYHIDYNNLRQKMHEIMDQRIDVNNHQALLATSRKIRHLIESVEFPQDLSDEIVQGYNQLFGKNVSVAVRSSAT